MLGERRRRLPAAPDRPDRSSAPVQRIAWRLIDRRVEIVAQRRAERHLVALLDRDLVDHRRPHALGFDRQKLHQGLGFGVEPLHRALGVGQRHARGVEVLARVAVRGFGGERGLLGLRHGGLRGFDRGRQRREDRGGFRRRRRGRLRYWRSRFRSGRRARTARARSAVSWLRRAVRSASAPVSSPKVFSAAATTAVGLGDAGIDAGAALGAGAHLVAERFFFLRELGQRGFGVGDQRALARDVLLELRQPPVELGEAFARAGFLGIERVAGDHRRCRPAAARASASRSGGTRRRRPRGPCRPRSGRRWRRRPHARSSPWRGRLSPTSAFVWTRRR